MILIRHGLAIVNSALRESEGRPWLWERRSQGTSDQREGSMLLGNVNQTSNRRFFPSSEVSYVSLSACSKGALTIALSIDNHSSPIHHSIISRRKTKNVYLCWGGKSIVYSSPSYPLLFAQLSTGKLIYSLSLFVHSQIGVIDQCLFMYEGKDYCEGRREMWYDQFRVTHICKDRMIASGWPFYFYQSRRFLSFISDMFSLSL